MVWVGGKCSFGMRSPPEIKAGATTSAALKSASLRRFLGPVLWSRGEKWTNARGLVTFIEVAFMAVAFIAFTIAKVVAARAIHNESGTTQECGHRSQGWKA